MSKGSTRRHGEIPAGAWETIFKPRPHDWPGACDCEQGKCKQAKIKDCKDWMKRSNK